MADPSSSRDLGAQARRVAELEERLEEQARRIQSLEGRLKRGEEELVNFQVFVQTLKINRYSAKATCEDSLAGAPSTPDDDPRSTLPELAPGAPQATVLASLGPPDERSERELHYYEQGVRVLLDEHGAVERVEVFGEATGAGPSDANGNRQGRFEQGGKWYRPGKWALHGVTMGMPGEEVVRHLGYPESVDRDALGLFHLWYPKLSLKLVLALEAPQRLIKVRRGGDSPTQDANGFVD